MEMTSFLQKPLKPSPALYPLPVRGGLLQRKCACGGTPGPSGECASCRAKRLGLQRAATQAASRIAPPSVHDTLRAPGQPLDPATRAFMEPRFGHDFSRVRVHTDAKAADSAQAVNALAYTVGHNVVFGKNSFSPTTRQGQALLAHELAHVIQQSASAPRGEAALPIAPIHSNAEREAEAIATDVLSRDQNQLPGRPPIRATGESQTISRTPLFTPDCGEYDRCKVIEPLRAATQLLDRVLTELPPLASGAVTSGRIVDLLNVHFHDPSNVMGRAAIVLDNFRAIRAESNASIRFICHPPAQDCSSERGSVGASTGDQPGGDISLCETYHQVSCLEQARILIHEFCHHIPATRIDRAYIHEANYMALPTAQATENPDTYAQFSKTVFLGTPNCKACDHEVQVRPGQY